MLFLIYFWCAFLDVYDNLSVVSNSTLLSSDNRNYKTLHELALDLERSEEARVKESSNCTQEDIRDSVQCFLYVPKSLYVVELNQTVEMPCVVLNQYGKVQWRANSTLLGYDRIIPGRPRFRIVGDPSKGEHILQIKNITSQDNGKYECQVQPIGIKHPPLRRITYVEVIELPEIPRLYYREKLLINNILEISIKDHFKFMELKCISKKGRPLLSFSWFINGDPVCRSLPNCDTQTLSSTESKLRFLPNDFKNLQNISCMVVNTATRRYPSFQNYQTLKVIIQTPPNTPEIQSFPNEKLIEISENDSIKLFCHCRPPGFPVASLYWEWRWSRGTLNTSRVLIDRSDFSVTHNTDISTISSLHLFHISRRYHSAFIHCVANHSTGLVSSSGVQIMIKYPPNYINITTSNDYPTDFYRNQNIILLNENAVKQIDCITSEYYGVLNLKWKMDTESNFLGKDLRSSEKVWQLESTYKQQSSITISLGPTIDEVKLNCVLFYLDKLILKTSITVMKIKRPEFIQIENYQSNHVVEEGQILNLNCLSRGGRPTPELVWTINGNPIVTSQLLVGQTVKNSLSLRLKIKRIHNNGTLRCQTQLKFFQSKPLSSRQTKLSVIFPPLKIQIENTFPKNLVENEIVFFSCSTTESNPPAGIVWKIRICKYTDTNICTEHSLSNIKVNITDSSENRGYETRSILKLTMSWNYHLAFLICETTFAYAQITFPILRSQIQLSISFKPNFMNIKNNSHILLKLDSENQSVHIQTVANPLPISFKWYYKNHFSSISVNGSSIFFQNINENIRQEYKLVASNKLGESVLIFYIDITYSPRIFGKRYTKQNIQSKITELECLIESNPTPQFFNINWTFYSIKIDFDEEFNDTKNDKFSCNQGHWRMKKLKLFVKCRLINQKLVSSSLIIYDTSLDDLGTYVCSANDDNGPSDSKTMDLVTLSSPNFISVPLFSKVAILSNAKSQAKTLIYSGVETNSTFHITMTLNRSFHFPCVKKELRTGIYLVTSEFDWTFPDDIEQIYWRAANKYGSAQLAIQAVHESVPDPPIIHDTKFRQPNLIVIKLIQTFDGGYPQIFEIYWRDKNQNSTKNKMMEIPGNYTTKYITVKISGVYANKNYEIQVCSKNAIHGRCRSCPTRIINSNERNFIESNIEETKDNLYELIFQFNLKIVIAVAGFVLIVILLAISIIIFLFKRKQHQSPPDIRSNLNLSFKYGNDLLIPNISINDTKSEYHSINSLDKSVIYLTPKTSHFSQSKV